jgi:phosphopantothenoylcysteine decarboxylase/phosphopantothenate--cysteine ligase
MLDWMRRRRILLGITGGISAYKAYDILHALVKSDCEVETVVTADGEAFVSPMVLATLSGRQTWTQKFFLSDEKGWQIPHINLSKWAELILVAPCTADTLARFAAGSAREILDAAVLAAQCPLLLFPAMNVHMFANPATQRNMDILKSRGFMVHDPEEGLLACGDIGKGRLPALDVILEEVWRILSPQRDLLGKRVLVTAGPTHEFLDPVRFISNPSSGRMGLAAARAAWYRGADVCLIMGPSALPVHHGFRTIPVVSADDMYHAVMENLDWADIIIKAAAGGDYRTASPQSSKIKRENKAHLSLDLVSNVDIVAEVGKIKRPEQFLLGFAAETEHFSENAKGKMEHKRLDAIVVNDVSSKENGFASESNAVRLILKDGRAWDFSGSKLSVADHILDQLPVVAKEI